MRIIATTILALTCATSFAQSVAHKTPDDYLAIISVGLPLVVMAFVVAAIVMKQEWIKKKGWMIWLK